MLRYLSTSGKYFIMRDQKMKAPGSKSEPGAYCVCCSSFLIDQRFTNVYFTM